MTKEQIHDTDARRTDATERNSSAATVVGFAIIGCLATGVVGILKALSMETGGGVLCCLLASVTAFGAVAYIYLRRD
jgi:hypothetical protein